MSFFRSVKFKIICAVLAVCFVAMLAASASNGSVSVINSVFGTVFAPLEYAASKIAAGMSSLSGGFISSQAYKEKAESLEVEVRELREQLVGYEECKQRLASYEQFVNASSGKTDMTTVYASIIARDAADMYGSFVLDKGSADGVKLNDPVVYGASNIVGIVKEVSVTSCVVKSIFDPDISLGVYEVRSRESGYLENNVETAFMRYSKFSGLTSASVVAEGGIVCTSGVGGICPRDLIVGTVVSVGDEDASVSSYALVKSDVDFDSITGVFIITAFPGQGA